MAALVSAMLARLSFDGKQYDAGMRNAQAQGDRFSRGLKGINSGLGNVQRAVLPVSAAVAGMFGVGIKGAITYNKQIANIASLTGRSAKETKLLSRELIRFGRKTPQGINAVADAYYQVVSGVSDATKHMGILKAAQKTSAAGAANLEQTTSALISVMNSYSFEASQASYVSDVLTRTVQTGVIKMHELAGSIGTVTSLGAEFRVGIDEIGASLAFMTQSGGSTEQRVTQLQGLFVAFAKPSEDLAKAIKGIGFESGRAALATLGLQGTLQKLNEKNDMSKLFSNIRATQGAIALAKDGADEFFADFQSGLQGATDKAYEAQEGALAFDILMSSLDGIVKQLSQPVAKALNDLVVTDMQPIVDVFTYWIDLSDANAMAVVKLGLTVIALVPVLWGLRKVLLLLNLAYRLVIFTKAKFIAMRGRWASTMVNMGRATIPLLLALGKIVLAVGLVVAAIDVAIIAYNKFQIARHKAEKTDKLNIANLAGAIRVGNVSGSSNWTGSGVDRDDAAMAAYGKSYRELSLSEAGVLANWMARAQPLAASGQDLNKWTKDSLELLPDRPASEFDSTFAAGRIADMVADIQSTPAFFTGGDGMESDSSFLAGMHPSQAPSPTTGSGLADTLAGVLGINMREMIASLNANTLATEIATREAALLEGGGGERDVPGGDGDDKLVDKLIELTSKDLSVLNALASKFRSVVADDSLDAGQRKSRSRSALSSMLSRLGVGSEGRDAQLLFEQGQLSASGAVSMIIDAIREGVKDVPTGVLSSIGDVFSTFLGLRGGQTEAEKQAEKRREEIEEKRLSPHQIDLMKAYLSQIGDVRGSDLDPHEKQSQLSSLFGSIFSSVGIGSFVRELETIFRSGGIGTSGILRTLRDDATNEFLGLGQSFISQIHEGFANFLKLPTEAPEEDDVTLPGTPVASDPVTRASGGAGVIYNINIENIFAGSYASGVAAAQGLETELMELHRSRG